MKDRTLKNQKKHINKTLKQFQLAKTMIQLSITGTVSVITASLSFYFCPGFSSQVIKDARSAISFVQTASGQKFHELEDFLKKQTQPEPKIQKQTELSEDTSRTQGILDTSSVTADTSPVTANTSPVILGKAEGRIALLGVAKQLTQRLFNARLQRRNAFRRPGRRLLK